MGDGSVVRIRVLGPSRLEVAGAAVPITPTQRRLVARLAATPDGPVTLAELFDALWAGEAPSSARAAVHNQVSRLRALAGRDVIATLADGYRLAVPTDVDELRRAVGDADKVLASDPARALALAERSMALAFGVPFADLDHHTTAAGLRRDVDELLDIAADQEVTAALALGLGARAVPAARRAAVAAPHDEARAARLAQALALVGRRGEALSEIARVRRSLRTDLGLDGSAALGRLEVAIRGDAASAAVCTAARHEVDELLAAVDRGRSVLVVGEPDDGVTQALAGVRDAMLGRGGSAVAMVRVQGYRDVAVAALLDLLDLLGVDTVPALGPVGTFVPAITRLAERRPVVLLVERFDAAGPSTRRVLLEAARLDAVTLVAGARSARPGELDVTITLADRRDGARAGGLRRRFAALPRIQRDALTAAAVAGDGVPTAALAPLGVAGPLDEVIAAGLLIRTSDDGIVFDEPALRDVILADTPSGVREELHHALGRVLADHGACQQAATHLLAASAIEPPAAVAAARAAADEASAAGAHHDAVDWLEQAASACHDEREQIALQIALGDALRLAGDPAHVDVLRAAADRAEQREDDALLGEAAFALLALGGTTVSTETDPGAEAVLSRAVARIRDDRRVALVKAAGSLACSMTGSAERSRRLFLEADAVAVPPAVRMRVLPFAYMSLGLPEDLPVRRRRTAELLELGETHGDPVATYEGLHLAFTVHLQDGDGAALRRVHAEMTGLVDRVGDVGRRWALHYLAAALAHLDGDLDEAERVSHAAFAQFAPVSQSRATAVLFGQLFGLRLAQGRVAELRPVLGQLTADQPGVPAWTAALALSLVDADPAGAITTARQALEIVQHDFSRLAAHLVGARAVALAVRSGAPDDGLLEAYRACLAPWSGHVSWQGTCSYGPVDTTLALIAAVAGDDDAATRLSAAAQAQSERLAAPVFAAELATLGLA